MDFTQKFHNRLFASSFLGSVTLMIAGTPINLMDFMVRKTDSLLRKNVKINLVGFLLRHRNLNLGLKTQQRKRKHIF